MTHTIRSQQAVRIAAIAAACATSFAAHAGTEASLYGVAAVYAAPKFGGFELSLMAAAGEPKTGATSNGDYFSANLRYGAGPIGVGLTLSHLNKPVDGDVAANAVLLAGTWDAGSFSLMGG